jgi:DNA processing protein
MIDRSVEPVGRELAGWIALAAAPGVGPVTFQRILEQRSCLAEIEREQRSVLVALGMKEQAVDYLASGGARPVVERVARWLEEPGHSLVTASQATYPPRLLELADPPPLLYLDGDPDYLCSTQLAMVGSRSSTRGGNSNAQAFARHLAGFGLTITSGLAEGIDAAAHIGALEGGGGTVAVVGTGLDQVYPRRHVELAARIREQGLLISELPLGSGPKAHHFPQRNRLIAGLSLGVLVVEAALRSGSLITARLANEQGREVFAIPGSIHNPMARGCHRLLREGAKLVESAADILEELAPLISEQPTPFSRERIAVETTEKTAITGDQDYHRLLAILGSDPLPHDQLVALSGLTAGAVSSMLLILELEGIIESLPGGLYLRTGSAGG